MAAGGRTSDRALWFVLGVMAGVVVCAAGIAGYVLWQSPQPAPPPSPEPTSVPTPAPPTPAPTLSPTPEATAMPPAVPLPVPTPRPSGTPAPPHTAQADLARRLGEGDRALAEGRWPDAQAAYEEALQLDPGNARAQAGHAQAAAGAARARRGFVPELASGEGRPAPAPAGFETGDVVVKRAPEVPARVAFEVSSAHVEPGAPYTITVALVNFGRKGIKLRSLRLVETVNGRRTLSEPPPQSSEVRKGQRATLAVLSGAWPGTTREWSLEVQVVAAQGDVYGGKLVWR